MKHYGLLLFIINGILNVKYAGHKVDKDELVVHNVSIFGMKNSYFKRDKILGMENNLKVVKLLLLRNGVCVFSMPKILSRLK